MIDLHTHTTYSDGSNDVITLLKKAEEARIEVLSITDHTSCMAYKEMKSIDIKRYYSGKLIYGCELFTTINGETIELLAYNINPEIFNDKLPKIYKYQLKSSNEWETNKLLEICKRIGIEIDYNKIELDFSKEFGSEVVHSQIIKNVKNKKYFDNERAWESSYVFYRECISNSNSKFFVDKSSIYPTPKEVINLIKNSGGLVFIPHIFVYGENSMKFFNELITNYDIDGIECYYTTFSDEETQFLLNYCKEHNLYISGGSDYHGVRKPDNKLGIGKGNLDIPYNIIEEWGKFMI